MEQGAISVGKTYGYYGIFFGIILGIAVTFLCDSILFGTLACVIGSVACFSIIRSIENLAVKRSGGDHKQQKDYDRD